MQGIAPPAVQRPDVNSKQIDSHPPTDELRVYFGDSLDVWRHTMIRNSYGPATMLPPGEDFIEYQWPVKERDVLMVQIGNYHESAIPSFSRHLVMQGAPVVRVLYGKQLSVFRLEGSHDIAA